MDFKKEAALTASGLIANGSIIGLGAGSSVAHIVNSIKHHIANGLEVEIVTSSFTTLQLLLQHGILSRPVALFKEIDIYFDGCDQFDKALNAVKSGGGIHTLEKLLASMAKEFILVGDEKKMVNTFDPVYPLVLEIIPQAVSFVPEKIKQSFRVIKTVLRMNDKRDGPVITENGNYLLDVFFQQWPAPGKVNRITNSITGIVETSLFAGLAHKAIVGGEKGVAIVEKKE